MQSGRRGIISLQPPQSDTTTWPRRQTAIAGKSNGPSCWASARPAGQHPLGRRSWRTDKTIDVLSTHRPGQLPVPRPRRSAPAGCSRPVGWDGMGQTDRLFLCPLVWYRPFVPVASYRTTVQSVQTIHGPPDAKLQRFTARAARAAQGTEASWDGITLCGLLSPTTRAVLGLPRLGEDHSGGRHAPL